MKRKKRETLLNNHSGRRRVHDEAGIRIIRGKNNILISAPHGFIHQRNKKIKFADAGTNSLVKILSEKTKCHAIYTTKHLKYDPNFDLNNPYKLKLLEYIKENDIKYFIDLHGMKKRVDSNVDIGTRNLTNINGNEKVIELLVNALNKQNINLVTVDKYFTSKKRTLCRVVNFQTGIAAIQIEASRLYRNHKNSAHSDKFLSAMIGFIYSLERIDNMDERNFTEEYDELLEIKPSFGYTRKLGKINYTQVGLEIEVSVNYEREKFSYIKKLLTKLKKIVGDNGFFVKDATIKGDYSFEIVLDPLEVDEIYKLYKKIYELCKLSEGNLNISKEYDCGIHMNFNQADVTDLDLGHRKLNIVFLDNPEYFEQNLYKKFKLFNTHSDYLTFQNDIASKYVWINYLDKKLIEIRNVKSSLTPEELKNLLNKLLSALYYDKIAHVEVELERSVEDIYQEMFENNYRQIAKRLRNDEMLIFKNVNGRIKLVNPSDKIKKDVKNIK